MTDPITELVNESLKRPVGAPPTPAVDICPLCKDRWHGLPRAGGCQGTLPPPPPKVKEQTPSAFDRIAPGCA